MKSYCIIFIFLLSFLTASSQPLISKKIFALIKLENFDKAIEFGEKRIKKLERKGKLEKRGIPYFLGLGMAHEKIGDWSIAEEYFQKAYQLVQKKSQRKKRLRLLEYDVLDEVALFYLHAGNYLLSKKIILESEQARKKRFHKNNPLRYRYFLPKGLYFYNRNQLDSSFHYLKKYVLYIKNSNHTQKVETNRLANAYHLLSKIEYKRQKFKRSLEYARKNKRYQSHRWTHIREGKNNLKRIEAYNLVAQNYRILQKHKKALKHNKKAFKIYRKNIKKDTYHKVPLLTTKALISWDLGNLDSTEKLLLEACELQLSFIQKNMSSLTEKEKENFYKEIKITFDLLYAFGIDYEINNAIKGQNFIEKLYNFQLQTKGIILNETNKIYNVISSSSDSSLINDYRKWIHKKNELAQIITANNFEKIYLKTDKLELEINQLEKILAKKTSLLSLNKENINWESIRDQLKQNETAIELIRVQKYDTIIYWEKKRKKLIKHHYKFLSDSIIYVALGLHKGDERPQLELIHNGNDLETKFASYYFNTIEYELEDTISFEQYWKPLLPIIGNKNTIYLSADGIYNLLNLSIIKTPQQKFLMDSYKIFNITNTKNLLDEEKQLKQLTNATLLGRPQFYNDSLHALDNRGALLRSGISDLPGTEEEVKKIATILTGNNIDNTILLGKQANEQNLKQNQSCSILHIATHGFFYEDDQIDNDPMIHSGLLLAQDPNNLYEDGILTAYEASGLNLNQTQLVVLSACVTGLGTIKHGEGVYGLQRAFEVAGVPYIIMSLWNVDDNATKELMVLFYRNLLHEKYVYNAYQNALLTLRKKYPNPIYWGAFKLLGK